MGTEFASRQKQTLQSIFSIWALIVLLGGMMLIGFIGTAIAYETEPPSIASTPDF